MAADNTSLGEFKLDGFRRRRAECPKIEMTFDIDASGILNVTAKDQATGKAQLAAHHGATRLSEGENGGWSRKPSAAEQDQSTARKPRSSTTADWPLLPGREDPRRLRSQTTATTCQRIASALRETREVLSGKATTPRWRRNVARR